MKDGNFQLVREYQRNGDPKWRPVAFLTSLPHTFYIEPAVIGVPESGRIRGWKHKAWGDEVNVDRTLEQAKAGDYDAPLLPGGVMNPDQLRMNPRAVQFVKQLFEEGKPIAVICHGSWTLVEAGVVRGFTMTSWPSIKTDLVNAGAKWVDQEVVVDRGVVSSRKPDDIPAFNRKMIEEFAEGIHGGAGRRAMAGTHA